MDRCKYNKFVGCNIKECDTCEVYKVYQQGRTDAIEEYSSKLWQVIEKATVNCKLDFTIDDIHNLEIIIKGLAKQMKGGADNEQNSKK